MAEDKDVPESGSISEIVHLINERYAKKESESKKKKKWIRFRSGSMDFGSGVLIVYLPLVVYVILDFAALDINPSQFIRGAYLNLSYIFLSQFKNHQSHSSGVHFVNSLKIFGGVISLALYISSIEGIWPVWTLLSISILTLIASTYLDGRSMVGK